MSEPQEWTPEYVAGLMAHQPNPKSQHVYQGYKVVSDAHNAALAAERQKSRILGNMTDGFRNQIKEHQAEYDRLSKIMEKDSLTIVELEEQLAAELGQTDLWKRQAAFESEHREKYRNRIKPLVEALEFYAEKENYIDDVLGMPDGHSSEVEGSNEINQDNGDKARAALASVKEQS